MGPQSDREDTVRKSDRIITRVIELWPFWLTLAGGVVSGINFYNTVKDLAANQRTWQASSETRRTQTHAEMDEMKIQVEHLKADVEWLKELRRKQS